MEKFNFLVAYKFRASKFEPEQERVVAAFVSLINAEDFIGNCIPEEEKIRFYIKSI